MTLQSQLASLITAIGTDWKNLNTKIGTLASLTTTDKTSTVAAINEVKASATGLVIDDTTPSTTKTYSSQKSVDLLVLKAPLASPTFTGTVSGITAAMVGLGNATNAALTSLIADASATTATATTYSANKINAAIAAAVSALVNSAPGTLDTLGEIATALAADESAAASLTTAVGNRLRFDAAQTLTAPQKLQGNTNLGSVSVLDAGDVTVDLVALYTAAKV